MSEQWEDLGLAAWIKDRQAEIYGGRKVLSDSYVEEHEDAGQPNKPTGEG